MTDTLIIAANLISQPASAFRNAPFGLQFGAPFPYDYCTHHYFGQQNFRNIPFGLPFGLQFGAPFPYDYCTHHYFDLHKFRNYPFELPFP
ncbi:MAG TPA: hypothetical protein VEL11_13440 [Candidatus Bathyarchaeia archaeon]|nr:hypothetical protein [Candidatus Bathyarchaeia archaeon]